MSEISFDASAYETKQVFFHTLDGFKIPMYIVSRKDIKAGQPHPLILTGYGGFGISEQPHFSPFMIPFLDAGGIYVVANIRGGGEYGGYWHMMGSGLNKVNSFKDFIGAANYLIQHKYTDKKHLVIRGGSNGGLLVAACVNMRPDLFKVAIAEMPVTDMLRFQKYTAGVHWVSEYGSSEYEESFKVLHSYSPIHNIKKGESYPAMLITTATNDDRVVPAHAYKYVAALQTIAAPSTASPILLRVIRDSGHNPSNSSKYTQEMADIYSFIFYNMGITPKW
jgi:prolyl oligopeptidase